MVIVMDKIEARAVIAEEIRKLRERSYEELLELRSPVTDQVVARSGKTYQVERQAFWDDKRRKTLRVLVSVDDGGWRSFFPLADDFIIAPDGSFVGE